ncbi:coil containing protein [Vibrio phage 1.265.O._10N.286.52.F6]|nr:coil containing protein [Vibrio phage 1.265.O._10N.286.52.F6]
MKMSDRFDLPLKFKSTPFLKDNSGESPIYSQFVFNDLDDNDRVDRAKYACHAINNHDRMVEEIAELRASEADLVNRNEDLLCIIDDLTRIARALDKPEKHTNSQHKRAKRDLCKLLAKLNQEGEE